MKELVELHHDLIQTQIREAEAKSDLEIMETRIAETLSRLGKKQNQVADREFIIRNFVPFTNPG